MEKAPSIAIAEHITNNHNVFSIRNLFSKHCEIDYQIYQQNVFPKLVITDNRKAIIQAVLNELNRKTLEEYLKRIHGIRFEDQKIVNTQKTQIRLCLYHIVRNNYAKLKDLTKDKRQMNFAQRVLGRLICCKSYAEAETIVLNPAIVMTTPEEDEKMQESFSPFRKHYVGNIAEAIHDPKDIQFTLKQYWNNLPAAEKEHFSQSSPSIRVNETFCFCKIHKHEKSKMGPLFACDICDKWYHSSCVKIDEDYLKCMPVSTCPPMYLLACFKESLFTLSSYAFKNT